MFLMTPDEQRRLLSASPVAPAAPAAQPSPATPKTGRNGKRKSGDSLAAAKRRATGKVSRAAAARRPEYRLQSGFVFAREGQLKLVL